MKGTTKIILTNVETGEVEVHEHKNLITNALDKVININVALNLALNSYVLPIATNALGGIMLFDGPLTEDPDNIHFPSEAHLVGYAGQDVNTTDKFRGSYNVLESGKTETGFVSVWDFGTTQANGTIKAVARTSAHAGATPLYNYCSPTYGTTGNGTPATDYYWYPIRYDGEYLYALKANESTHVMRLARIKIPVLRMGVADYSDVKRTYEVIADWNTEILPGYVYADDPFLYEDGHDGYIYCMAYSVSNTEIWGSYDIQYFTIKYGDGSYERSETQRLHGRGDYYSDQKRNTLFLARRYCGHVHRGVLYRMSKNRKSIWRLPLDNLASYSQIRVFPDDSPDYIEDLGRIISHEGVIYIECYHYTATSYNRLNGAVYPDGIVVLPDYSYAGQHNNHNNAQAYNDGLWTCDDDLIIWGYYTNDRFTREWASNYLGTINNLPEEIVKTPAQTMKIVYTLTDIDSDDEEEGQDDEPGG